MGCLLLMTPDQGAYRDVWSLPVLVYALLILNRQNASINVKNSTRQICYHENTTSHSGDGTVRYSVHI
jgi:hypothetical protein